MRKHCILKKIGASVLVLTLGVSPVNMNVRQVSAEVLPASYSGTYMAFSTNLDNRLFDIRGVYDNKTVQTTYSNNGYESYMKVGNASSNQLKGFTNGESKTYNDVLVRYNVEATDLKDLQDTQSAKTVTVTYTLTNNSDNATDVSLGIAADVKIGENDSATVKITNTGFSMTDDNIYNTTYGTRFMLNAVDTQFTTKWIGEYYDRENNVYNNSDIIQYGDEDSGLAASWNVHLEKGETESRKMKYEVVSAPIIKSTTASINGETKKLNFSIDYFQKAQIDMTQKLFYKIDDGSFIEYGEIKSTTAQNKDNTFSVNDIDVSSWQAGTSHQLSLYIQDNDNASSEVVTYSVSCPDSSTSIGDDRTIKFHTTGQPIADIVNKDGTLFKIPDSYRNGYILDYWIDGNDSKQYKVGDDYTITNNAVLTAVYAQAKTVNFNSNGGSSVEPQNVISGSKVNKPTPDPQYGDYKFLGWYESNLATTQFDFENTQITADKMLYARWEVTAPNIPTIAAKTDQTIVINSNANVEYMIKNSSDTEELSSWVSNGSVLDSDTDDNTVTISGLTQNTQYKVAARVKMVDVGLVAAESTPINVKTKESAPATPTAEVTVTRKTDTTITISAEAGKEYRVLDESGNVVKDWTTGTDGKVTFDNLTASTNYKVSQRVAETDTAMPSGEKATDVTTKASAPTTPTADLNVIKKTDTAITIGTEDGHEYKIVNASGEIVKDWTTGTDEKLTFDNLTESTNYTISARVAETDTVMPSPAKDTDVTTKESAPATPTADVTVTSKTDNVITISAEDGKEYKIVDELGNVVKDWTTGTDNKLTFDNLTESTKYTVIQRVAETNTAMPSGEKDTDVTTKESAPATPTSDVTVLGKTDTTITISAELGKEYCVIDASGHTVADWTIVRLGEDKITFDNLTASTKYTVMQRIAETDTVMPSAEKKTDVTTKESAPATPTADVTVTGKTDTTITISAEVGKEYRVLDESGNVVKDWTTGKDGKLTFDKLTSGTKYMISQRISETDTAMPSGEKATDVTTKEVAPATPTVDVTVSGKTDTTITISAEDGKEYKIIDELGKVVKDWTTGTDGKVAFDNLTASTNYTISQRVAETDTVMPSGEKKTDVTTKASAPATPTADVTVTGKTDTTITISAEVGKEYRVLDESGNVVKDWTTGTDGKITFNNLTASTNYEVSQRVAETDTVMPSAEKKTDVTTKASAPATPTADVTVTSKTDTVITISAEDGKEYKIVDESGNVVKDWTTETDGKVTFDNLTEATNYTISQRVAETDIAMPSAIKDTDVTTKASAPATPTADVTITGKTDTVITISAEDGKEYKIVDESGNVVKDWTTGTDGKVTFDNLTASTNYTISQRVAETDTAMPSAEKKTDVTTKSSAPITPADDVTVLGKTDTTITISADLGKEYCVIDSSGHTVVDWSIVSLGEDKITFDNLTASTKYTVMQRVAETDTVMPSGEKKTDVITKASAPATPTEDVSVTSKTDTTITISAEDGKEYKIIDESGNVVKDWTTGTNGKLMFDKLTASTNYTISQRVAETDTAMPSAIKDTDVTTKASVPATPTADATVTSKTDTAITISAEVGKEYKIVDESGNVVKDWTTGTDGEITFDNLVASTNYTISQRIAETDTVMPSAEKKTDVTTKASAPATPTVDVTVSGKTDTLITISAEDGKEYKIVDESGNVVKDWTTGTDGEITFDNLVASTNYTISQRIAETDTVMPSAEKKTDVTTKESAPATPTVDATVSGKTDTAITIGTEAGKEYRVLDESGNVVKDWTTGKDGKLTFDKLTSGTKYTISQRVAETDTSMPSAEKKTDITTKASPAETPTVDATVSGKTDTSITIGTEDGKEYRILDESGKVVADWTTGTDGKVTFDKLTPGTKYTISQRVAETDTSMPSVEQKMEISTKLTAPLEPSAPAVLEKTDTSITIKSEGTNEYRILDEKGNVIVDWTTDKDGDGKIIFSKLKTNITYSIICRTKETEQTMASKQAVVTVKIVEKPKTVVSSNDTDENVKGAKFLTLKARMSKVSKNSVKIKWSKVNGADGYLIYGSKCGKKNKMKLVSTVSKETTNYKYKNLKKGTFYKIVVRAYKNVSGRKVIITSSKTIHEVTKGGKYTGIKKLKINKKSVNLKIGKTFKIKAKEVKVYAKKKLKHHAKVCYELDNNKIAKVSKKGVITAKSVGICNVVVYAQNGKYKVVKVNVTK